MKVSETMVNCISNCENYCVSGYMGEGEHYYYCYKCNDCGREWFDVFQLVYMETVEGNLEESYDYS